MSAFSIINSCCKIANVCGHGHAPAPLEARGFRQVCGKGCKLINFDETKKVLTIFRTTPGNSPPSPFSCHFHFCHRSSRGKFGKYKLCGPRYAKVTHVVGAPSVCECVLGVCVLGVCNYLHTCRQLHIYSLI